MVASAYVKNIKRNDFRVFLILFIILKYFPFLASGKLGTKHAPINYNEVVIEAPWYCLYFFFNKIQNTEYMRKEKWRKYSFSNDQVNITKMPEMVVPKILNFRFVIHRTV